MNTPQTHIGSQKVRERLSKDRYLMTMARTAALRSTCLKRQVGAIVADMHGRVLGTGYNGAPALSPHCLDAGCLLNAHGKCIRAVHAEVNAFIGVPAYSESLILYSTCLPCIPCLQVAAAHDVIEVVYQEEGSPDPELYQLIKIYSINLKAINL